MEDEAIVRLFLARQEEAVSLAKEKYGGRLRQIAYGITGDAQEAEECENDTYLRAWRAIPPQEPYDHLYAFLACIVRNAALNRVRDRGAQKRGAAAVELTREMEQVLASDVVIEDMIDDEALRTLLNTFLAGLPKETRVVFVRRYWYLDSMEQIASARGISVSKVKSMLFRCRNKLKRLLEKEGYRI